MSNTQVSSQLQVTRFLNDYFREYVRKSRFMRYTGTDANKVIVMKQDLNGKGQINIPLTTRLKGVGQTGSSTLRGNEESLSNYADTLTPTYYRHGVAVDLEEDEKTVINIMKAGREALMDWMQEKTRDQIIEAMGAVYDGTTYANYGSASEAVKDAWLANNSDRVLFGAAKSNNSGNDHSASLANVDSTTDKLDTGILDLMKEMAVEADRKIRPLRVAEDEEYFVVFCGSRAWRDLGQDTALQNADRDARARGTDNPLFKGGDRLWNGMVIRHIPEITSVFTANSGPLSGVGASSIDVEPVFLCGAQAVGFGLGKKPKLIPDSDYDYGFQPGVEGRMKHHIKKLMFNNIQHGVVTGYVSGVASS